MPHLFRVFRTIKESNDRITEKEPFQFIENAPWMACMIIDPDVRFQTIEGFGGAFTESAAVLINKLSPKVSAEIVKANFDTKSGSGNTLWHDFQMQNSRTRKPDAFAQYLRNRGKVKNNNNG